MRLLGLITPSGLVFDVLAYGVMDESHFYQMLHKASRIYYYEKELATFEDFVATLKTALEPKPYIPNLPSVRHLHKAQRPAEVW